jgi:hypothetical protein
MKKVLLVFIAIYASISVNGISEGDADLKQDPSEAIFRPDSYGLPQNALVPEIDKGSRIIQLHDQDGDPCQSSALVLEGSEWIQIENLSDGKVEVSWDRNFKTDQAKLLLGWSGGTTAHEMNDWTIDPFELVIR